MRIFLRETKTGNRLSISSMKQLINKSRIEILISLLNNFTGQRKTDNCNCVAHLISTMYIVISSI